MNSRDNAVSVLKGEGIKRVVAFVFEGLFHTALQRYCPELPVALGWSVVSRGGGQPELWMKHETDALNAADEAMLRFLDTTGCAILKARYCETARAFLGAWRIGGEWQSEQKLGELLRNKYGAQRPVQEPKNTSPDEAVIVLERLFERQTPEQTRALVLSRMLINCFVSPYCKAQPMDIDAVAVNASGELRFLEFKRKYPSYEGLLSLDEIPHIALARWLLEHEQMLSSIVLCDPSWRNKNLLPLHLLGKASRTRPFAYWLGLNVTSEALAFGAQENALETHGPDSGMNSNDRPQQGFSVGQYVVLGQSSAPRGLPAFLNHERLPAADLGDLRKARNAARKIMDEPEKRA